MLPLSSAERGRPTRPKSSSATMSTIVIAALPVSEARPQRTRQLCAPRARLLWAHIALAAVHTSLAICTLALTKNWNLAAPVFSIAIDLNYTMDHDSNIKSLEAEVASGTIGSMEEVFDARLTPLDNGLPITWLTFAFFAITAFFHLGNGILWYRYYLFLVYIKFNWLRWLEYAITAPLMWLVVAQAFAFVEVTQLVLSTAMIAITMASGITVDWVARPEVCEDKWCAPLWVRLSFMIPGILLYGTAALTLVVSMITSVTGDLPGFVIPAVLVTLGLFESFAVVLIVQQCMRPSNWIYGETWYLILSLLSKAFLGITLLSNVLIYEDYACVFDAASC